MSEIINYELKPLYLPKGAGIIISEITGINRNTISRVNVGVNKSLFTRKRITDCMDAIKPFMEIGFLSEQIIEWYKKDFPIAIISDLKSKGISDQDIDSFRRLRKEYELPF